LNDYYRVQCNHVLMSLYDTTYQHTFIAKPSTNYMLH